MKSNFPASFLAALATLFVLTLGIFSPAHAEDLPGLAVVKASDCFTCHRVGQKLIGPAYKDVAVKYKGADDATIEVLAKKIIDGGSGNWGAVPMRAHPTMSLDDAKKAVLWVLSLADASAAPSTPVSGSIAPNTDHSGTPPSAKSESTSTVPTPNVDVSNTPTTSSNLLSLQGYFTPELLLMIGTIVLLFFSFSKSQGISSAACVAAIAFLATALALVIVTPAPQGRAIFEGMLAFDAFGRFFKVIILLTAIVTCLISDKSYDLKGLPKVEFYSFLLASTLGLMVMSVANDLLMIYLAVEMASIVSYILAGYVSLNKRSEEASLKYVFYGGMASGVMIFGLSLLYGLTGTLNLIEMREFFLSNPTDRLVLFVTFIFVLTGLGYKMAIAPFHMWSPDVYEGAPIAITAFLSVASKAAGFAMTVRFFLVGFIDIDAHGQWLALKALDWQFLVAVLAALTMTVGNLVALRQDNIKRFLAYSSVAHAGYLLMGLAAQSSEGVVGILVYLMVYFLMNLGAFLVAVMVANQFGTENIADYKGLMRRKGFGFAAAGCLSVFLLSLAGIPPFAGFVGKWFIFGAVMKAGSQLLWLAVVGVLNSVVSLFYYVRIMKLMIFDEPDSQMEFPAPELRYSILVAVFAGLTVSCGLFFSPLANWAASSAKILH